MENGTLPEISRERILKIYKETRLKIIDSAKSSMQDFVLYTKPDYDMQWFHKLVCAYLDKLYSGEIKKLMIFIPPQHGKSELSSRRFPAYVLGRNPKAKIGVASYSGDLSSSFNRDCQNIIDDERYIDVFPETRLKGDNSLKHGGELRNNHFFEIVKHRGFFKSVGVGSGLTGTPLDLGIVDDPFKDREEANSETYRNKVWNWYQDVFLTRMHNDSKQLLLFTRWHEDDIAGRILNPKSKYYNAKEAAEWTVIAIPALKESTPPLKQAIEIADPREIGEALWESRHAAEKYERRKLINPTGFNSLDQQRPTAQGGNKIRKEWFEIKKENELPFNMSDVAPNFWIDGAFTDKTKNDETGLLSGYFNKADGKLYIFNCSGIRKELYELLKYFKGYAVNQNYKAQSSVFIELKASGHPLKSMLSKVEHGGFNTRAVNNKVVALGKFNRVENIEPTLASGKVVLVHGAWNETFLDQCMSFPNGDHDDMVDVLCYAVFYYFIKKSSNGTSYE